MNIISNTINYRTESYPAAGTTKNKADRYATLRKFRKAEEDQKVKKQLAALKKAKSNGTLNLKARAKNIATENDREIARFFCSLINPQN